MSNDASPAAAAAEQSDTHAAIGAECMRGEQTLDEISQRLYSIKPMIDLPAVRHQVRRVIHFVAQHNHDLLDGRHMDQIVLAGLYGICRIHQADVTFKDLVEAYKRMPSASKELWLNVPLLEPGRTGNIIAFYNEVFVPRCKDYLHGMKDATIPGVPHSYARYVAESAAAAAGGGAAAAAAAATLTNSPAGFRQSKRARTDERKPGSEAASAGASDDAEMPPPHSPTRKPRVGVPRSPFAEFPASPFKRKAVVSPLRGAASPARRQVLASGRGGGGPHASPARTQHAAQLRGSHTPRTAFLHSFGTLGTASPAPSAQQGAFDSINGRLKGEDEPGTAVPRAASRPLGYDRAGASGLDALANGSGPAEGSIAAPPRTLSRPHGNAGSSALLALAQASDYKRMQAASDAAVSGAPPATQPAAPPAETAQPAQPHAAEPAAPAAVSQAAPPPSGVSAAAATPPVSVAGAHSAAQSAAATAAYAPPPVPSATAAEHTTGSAHAAASAVSPDPAAISSAATAAHGAVEGAAAQVPLEAEAMAAS